LHFCVKAIRLVFYLFHHKDLQWLLLTYNALSVKASVLKLINFLVEIVDIYKQVGSQLTTGQVFRQILLDANYARLIPKESNLLIAKTMQVLL